MSTHAGKTARSQQAFNPANATLNATKVGGGGSIGSPKPGHEPPRAAEVSSTLMGEVTSRRRPPSWTFPRRRTYRPPPNKRIVPVNGTVTISRIRAGERNDNAFAMACAELSAQTPLSGGAEGLAAWKQDSEPPDENADRPTTKPRPTAVPPCRRNRTIARSAPSAFLRDSPAQHRWHSTWQHGATANHTAGAEINSVIRGRP